MRLEARSESLPHLFEDLARQLFGELINPADIGEALREKVSVEGESLEELAREWVNALLDLLKAQHMVFKAFHVTEVKTTPGKPYSLRADATGELLDTHRHSLRQDASLWVCKHALLIKNESGYRVEMDLG